MAGMAAPYQSAEIWAVDFQENHCHQTSDLKTKMHAPKSISAGDLPQTPLGSLQRSPRSPSWI